MLLLVATTAACRAEEPRRPAEPAAAPTAPAAPADGWRTETWAGLSVDVPADWTYGGAPMRLGGGERGVCPPAVMGPDDGATGWVGRPVLLSDVCAFYPWIPGSRELTSTTPFVWLGAAVRPGVVRYEGGLVQQTIATEGTTLTVGSADAGLRRRILASARPAELCRPGGAPPAWTEVCGYRRTDGGELVLGFAEKVDPAVMAETVTAARAAAEVPPGRRCRAEPGEVVELRDARRMVRVDLACATVDVGDAGDADVHRLTVGARGAWATPVAHATLSTLIGPQG
ncbi:hypothetical protein ABFU82_03730 [Nocardioides sp. WV_118_6]